MNSVPKPPRRPLTFVVAATLVALLGAFAPGSSGAREASSTPLVIDMPVGPATLDPAEECGLSDFTVTNAVYTRLTRYGSKAGPDGTSQVDPGHIVPYLAKSWTISKNGLVYTFHLHSGVKFADGDPVDSAAVKYSLERSVTMGGCGGYFIYDGIYTPPLIKSITTPDPLTVVISLSVPDSNVLQDWAQPAASIVDEKTISQHGGVQKGKVNTWMAGNVTPGAGPYLLQSYQANKQAVFVANPKFFQQPASSKVIVNFISSDPTLVLQAKNGTADVTLGLSKQSAHSLASDPNVKVVSDNTSIAEQIGLPNDKAPFNNVKFREALSYAVPYQQILTNVIFGYGTLYYGAFPPAMPEFRANLEPPRTYDLAKAKQLITESGVSTPVTVSMDVQAGNPIDQQIATIVQGAWQQLGVNVQISTLSPTDYINALEQHKAQSYVRLDGPGVIEAGYFLGYDMKCGIGFNLSATCIPKADKLLAIARKTIDPVKKQKLWDEINALWIADSPKIPVYGDKYVSVLNKRVVHYYYSHELDFTSWAAE
jgi:peptide/nickel transport system substrate-binding protein